MDMRTSSIAERLRKLIGTAIGDGMEHLAATMTNVAETDPEGNGEIALSMYH